MNPRFAASSPSSFIEGAGRPRSADTEYDESMRSGSPIDQPATIARDDYPHHDTLREANRLHCKQTRERRKRREQLLREEVEFLTLCKAIVENGPDLFSLHRVDERAPFSFLCENFYKRLHVDPEDILGQPLASVVDPSDRDALRQAVREVLSSRHQGRGVSAAAGATIGGYGGTPGLNGSLIHLRLLCRGVPCPASMTIVIGSQGLIVVTRLYDEPTN